MTNLLWVMAGAAIGGAARYGVNLLMASWLGMGFPFGTLTANLTGSFLIGVLAAMLAEQAGPAGKLFWITGILGGYTTFSSFSLELVQMLRGEARITAVLYGIGSVVLGMVATAGGLLLGGRRAG